MMSNQQQEAENVQELKAQYLGHILGMMKQSTDLKMEGYHWQALEHLETIMSFLVLDKKGEEACEGFLKEIEGARNESYLQVLARWPSSHTKEVRLGQMRNKYAFKIYNPLLRSIQNELKRQAYYSFLGFPGGRVKPDPVKI